MTIPTRHVVIVRDTVSPLWVMRCAKPDCCAVCHLGGYLTRETAIEQARGFGYTVEERNG